MSTYGSFEIKGIEDIQKAIIEKYSGAKTSRIINSAISEGSEYFVGELREAVGTFKDKGHEQAEIVVTKPRKTVEGHKAKVGWNGPKKRYALVHLNEFGYTKMGKQYTPRGFGKIVKTVDTSGKEYYKRVSNVMKEML